MKYLLGIKNITVRFEIQQKERAGLSLTLQMHSLVFLPMMYAWETDVCKLHYLGCLVSDFWLGLGNERCCR